MKALNLQLLSRVYAQPWAMPPAQLALMSQLLMGDGARPKRELVSRGAHRLQAGEGRVSKTVQTEDGPVEVFAQAGYEPLNFEGWRSAQLETLPEVPPGVTVILVWGILGRGWTSDDLYYLDAVEVDELTAAIERTPEGSTVVLWMRSPGGIITGIPETAAFLRAAGKKRRILVWTDDLCASAAYWLASQAERIFSTPTADVGSIGVYLAFYDFTVMLEKAGVKLELFKAGRMKAMGLPGNPVSEEEARYLQEGVDEGYRQFTADVLRNREIDPETMQGQTHRGAQVLARNLVDGQMASTRAFFQALRKGKV